jgi:hypothetical protein
MDRLFAEVSRLTLELLTERFSVQHFAGGEEVCAAGAAFPAVLIIVHGVVLRQTEVEGPVVEEIGSGSVIGWRSVLLTQTVEDSRYVAGRFGMAAYACTRQALSEFNLRRVLQRKFLAASAVEVSNGGGASKSSPPPAASSSESDVDLDETSEESFEESSDRQRSARSSLVGAQGKRGSTKRWSSASLHMHRPNPRFSVAQGSPRRVSLFGSKKSFGAKDAQKLEDSESTVMRKIEDMVRTSKDAQKLEDKSATGPVRSIPVSSLSLVRGLIQQAL